MCWNFEVSVAFTAAGIIASGYMVAKKQSRSLWIPLLYFTSMELLQALMFATVGQCNVPRNQAFTILGYLHVTFQPFFINMIALYFIPERIKTKIAPLAYTACGIGAAIMLLKLYPFTWAGTCSIGDEMFCSNSVCTYWGNWHLAWGIPLNGWLTNSAINWGIFTSKGAHVFAYFFVAFVVPSLYGSWRFTLFQWLLGPMLALLLTNNANEYPAIWCFFSIAICLAVMVTPLRNFLHVKRWFFYNEQTNPQ